MGAIVEIELILGVGEGKAAAVATTPPANASGRDWLSLSPAAALLLAYLQTFLERKTGRKSQNSNLNFDFLSFSSKKLQFYDFTTNMLACYQERSLVS